MKKLDTICRLKKSEGILTNKNGSVKILGGFKMAGAIMDKIWGVIGMNNNNQSEAEDIEDEDYDLAGFCVGVVEEESPEIIIEYVNSQGIKMTVNGNGATMTYYNVAGNCGVYSYDGLNDLFDSCDYNVELFKKAMLAIIETFTDAKIGCMLIFSTNYKFEEIWDVMDEIMDTQSEAVNNPNSEKDVKLWIKYAYYERPDYDEEEY